MAAEEGPLAQWGLQTAGVGDGFTDEHQALQGGLQVGAPCWGRLRRGLVGPHVARAVQHLVGMGVGRANGMRHVGLGFPVGLGGFSPLPRGPPGAENKPDSETLGALNPAPRDPWTPTRCENFRAQAPPQQPPPPQGPLPPPGRALPTFQVAALRLRVRPLLVRVLFMRREKHRSVGASGFFLDRPGDGPRGRG